MAAEKLQLDLEALACSAAHVAGQGEDLATAHLSADTRVAAGSRAEWAALRRRCTLRRRPG
jgi:hypothetical protein